VALLGVEAFPEFNNPDFSGGECPDADGQGGEAWPCTPVGAYAHELGHTLGVIHPMDNPATVAVASHSIMQTHWHYPDEAPPSDRPWGFLRSERQLIRMNPFMKTDVELKQIHQNIDVAVNLPPGDTTPLTDFNIDITRYKTTFINNSQGGTLHYWTFGDHGISNEIAPIHTYLEDGVYTVILRVSNEQSMMKAISSTIEIPGDYELFFPVVTNNSR
jgi:hypothetical protein